MTDQWKVDASAKDRADSKKAHALVRQLADHAREYPSESVHSRVILQTEVDGVRCVLFRQNDDAVLAPSLSPREHEIARLIARGEQNKSIADLLQISVWTVNTHVRRIYNKLGVTSRAALARQVAELEWSR